MSDLNSGKIIKKRGRKPKNKLLETQPIINEIIDTENDVIITHLPITINDLKLKENQTDIFIKLEGKSPSNNEKIIDNQISSIESDNKSSNGIYVNKINTLFFITILFTSAPQFVVSTSHNTILFLKVTRHAFLVR